jgi:hypothetical protein
VIQGSLWLIHLSHYFWISQSLWICSILLIFLLFLRNDKKLWYLLVLNLIDRLQIQFLGSRQSIFILIGYLIILESILQAGTTMTHRYSLSSCLDRLGLVHYFQVHISLFPFHFYFILLLVIVELWLWRLR